MAFEVGGIKLPQLIVTHAATIKSLAAQLGQCHHGVASRAATACARRQVSQLVAQRLALVGVYQGHVTLEHTHGDELVIGHFKLRIN